MFVINYRERKRKKAENSKGKWILGELRVEKPYIKFHEKQKELITMFIDFELIQVVCSSTIQDCLRETLLTMIDKDRKGEAVNR